MIEFRTDADRCHSSPGLADGRPGGSSDGGSRAAGCPASAMMVPGSQVCSP